MSKFLFHNEASSSVEPQQMNRGGAARIASEFAGIPERRFGGPRTNNPPAQGGRRGSQGYISQQEIEDQIQQSIRDAIAGRDAEAQRGIEELESRLASVDENVQSQIQSAVANLPQGVSEERVQQLIDANPGLTRDAVLQLIQNNPGVGFDDVENAINTALTSQQRNNEQQLRVIAERIFQEQTGRFNQNIGGDRDEALGAEREDFINNFIRQQQSRETLTSEQINNLVQQQINAGLESGDYVQGGDVTQTIQDLIAAGTLTPDEIQRRIDAGDITKDDVLAIIQGGFSFTEEQYAELFSRGVLTRDEIAALVDAAIAETDAGDDITTEDVERIAQAAGITEDQVLDLISQQLEGFDPNIDTSGFATQDQLSQFATQDQLGNFATQEQLQGLESLFQNYLSLHIPIGYLHPLSYLQKSNSNLE